MAEWKTRMDWAILPQPVAEVRQVSPKNNCKTKMENRETVEHSVKKKGKGCLHQPHAPGLGNCAEVKVERIEEPQGVRDTDESRPSGHNRADAHIDS